MTSEDLKIKYEKMQKQYGDKSLKAITFGGCVNNPDICFVFMNPTAKNVASSSKWDGIRAPWIGTKNIWDLFVATDLFDKKVYEMIKSKKTSEWDSDFANLVYNEVSRNRVFITNLGKCTQLDARPIANGVYERYLDLLEKEIEIINPQVIILFGNQVSSVFLNQKIAVSLARRKEFTKVINNKEYKCYSVYYPVGNGRFNIDKSIADILWIKENVINNGKVTIKN